ncbi:MvdC/MvdD family ATP grasp protein [Lysobacter firmicutimachus]|uniref:MvdC/MvdD family ATP grasp protein n=1 Tax=Lysobacter firmicutimachus TaxID=1792846 RepID=A0AAU8MX61_9GAMM
MILVISHDEDIHARRVVEHLQSMDQPVLLFDLAELPDRATLSIEYATGARPRIDYARAGGEHYALDRVRSAWWRRPQAPDLSRVTDANAHLFTANEWNEALNGLWRLLGDARWMNDPGRDDAASRKAAQLRIAAELGLKVPRTLISSDPQRVRAFVEARGPGATVHKTFSCTHAVWRETRRFDDRDLPHLDTVRLAPVIFQEFVPADADIRVTAVDGQLFAAEIKLDPGSAAAAAGAVDFRPNLGDAEVREHALPEPVRERLRALMQKLGLVYGAIDLRRTPDGEYYFFEVNTAGEFLFIEHRTGQPIARAVADWLAGVSRSA